MKFTYDELEILRDLSLASQRKVEEIKGNLNYKTQIEDIITKLQVKLIARKDAD